MSQKRSGDPEIGKTLITLSKLLKARNFYVHVKPDQRYTSHVPCYSYLHIQIHLHCCVTSEASLSNLARLSVSWWWMLGRILELDT